MADIDLGSLLKIVLAAQDHHDESKPEVKHDLPALANQAEGLGLGALALKLLSSPEIVALLVSLIGGMAKKQEDAHVARVTPPEPAAPVEAAPVAPPKVVAPALPDSTGLDVQEVFGPDRSGRKQRKFRVSDEVVDGHYALIMLEDDGVTPDQTTSLDDASGLYLAGELMLAGKSKFIEEVPGAAGLLYWKVKSVDTGEENKLSFVNGDTSVGQASNNEHATNWRVEEFVRTRGFNPVLHLHDRSRGGYDITFGVEGAFEAVPIRTPAVL